jgi:hypothetical protein
MARRLAGTATVKPGFGVSKPAHFGSAETAAIMGMLSATPEIDAKEVNQE